jgi:hypothetical protein
MIGHSASKSCEKKLTLEGFRLGEICKPVPVEIVKLFPGFLFGQLEITVCAAGPEAGLFLIAAQKIEEPFIAQFLAQGV